MCLQVRPLLVEVKLVLATGTGPLPSHGAGVSRKAELSLWQVKMLSCVFPSASQTVQILDMQIPSLLFISQAPRVHLED